MLQLTKNGTTLKENLTRDNFFNQEDNILNIIDDYNIVDIEDDAINFYVKSFKDVGLKTLNIFFQVKSIKEQRLQEIEYFANNNEIEPHMFLAYCVLAKKDFYPVNDSIRSIVVTRKNRLKLEKALIFMDKMKDIGIDVRFCPYYSLNFNPPFHGRYWLTNTKGYIVDASLNTYGKGKIFVQLMDEENFAIIKEDLFDNCVLKQADDFTLITSQDLRRIIKKLYHRN